MDLDLKAEMKVRRITLSDGRYLIFYEFVPSEPGSASFKNQEADESLAEKEEASV
jgi:hypothetical protein